MGHHNRSSARHRRVEFQALERRFLLSVTLPLDVNTTPISSTATKQFVDVDGTAFFVADDVAHGPELWKSNGTAAGTVMVADISPGTGGSAPTGLTNVGGTLYFAAWDGAHGGDELWRSDGTTAGTWMVKDIDPSTINADSFYSPKDITAVGGNVYFFVNSYASSNTRELWRRNGTTAGTVKLQAFTSVTAALPYSPVAFGGSVYFLNPGSQLWTSDGATGTVTMVTSLTNTSGVSIDNLVATPAALFFTQGNQLWVSDGTAAGTSMVTTIGTGSSISNLTVAGSRVFFVANDGTTGNELWCADGASAWRVADLYPGSTGSSPASLTAMGDRVYFTATTSATGNELWVSDGTSVSLVSDVRPGTSSSSPVNLAAAGGRLYFAASDGTGHSGAWVSDGTAAGTKFLQSFAGYSANKPCLFAASGGRVIFAADDGAHGLEPWTTDGSTAGTHLLRDIYPRTDTSKPRLIGAINGRLYYAANDGVHGYEVWYTDGTAAGTGLLKDIAPGTGDAFRSNDDVRGVTVGKYLYFLARPNGSSNYLQLIRTDGTAAGTVALTSGSGDAAIRNTLAGVLYFTANAFSSIINATDDSAAGYHTVVASWLPDSPTDFLNSPTRYVTLNGHYYGIGYDSTYGFQVWQSDGTPEGTHRLTAIGPLPNTSSGDLEAIGGSLLFFAGKGKALYKIQLGGDPVLVKDLSAGGGFGGYSAVVGNRLFYTGYEPQSNSTELWVTDGTSAGTYRVADLAVGSAGSNPEQLMSLNGVVLFRATVNSQARLYRSDGTAAGTYALGSVVPDHYGALGETGFAPLGGYAYVASTDATSMGIWRTDGTNADTTLLTGMHPGTPSTGELSQMTAVAGALFLTGDDGVCGGEVWRADPVPVGSLDAGGMLTISGTANNDVVHLASAGSSLQVTLDGLTQTFSAGSVSSIVIDGAAGQDEVDVDSPLNAPLQFAGTSQYALNVNAGTVTLVGNAMPTGSNIAIGAGGAVVFGGSESLGSLTIADGTASIPNGLGATLTVAGQFSISGGGTLDLGNNALLVPSTPDVAAYVGRAAGAAQTSGLNPWNGSGLTSGLVKADAANGNAKQLAVGCFDSRDNAQTGLSVPAGQTLVKVTVYGDATGDGKVSIADLSVWNNNFGVGSPRWSQGDFNYDGKVNIADLSVWNNDFGNNLANTGAGAAAVTSSAVTSSANPAVVVIDPSVTPQAAGASPAALVQDAVKDSAVASAPLGSPRAVAPATSAAVKPVKVGKVESATARSCPFSTDRQQRGLGCAKGADGRTATSARFATPTRSTTALGVPTRFSLPPIAESVEASTSSLGLRGTALNWQHPNLAAGTPKRQGAARKILVDSRPSLW